MTKEQFEYLCDKLGDPNLEKSEKWRSIQAIHIHGSYEPLGDFQQLLKSDQIYYVDDPTLGPGFFYLSTPDPSYKVLNGQEYSISWLDLTLVSEITFVGFHNYPKADSYRGISDIIAEITGKSIKLPVYVTIQGGRIKREKVQKGNYQIAIGFDRELNDSDYEISFSDEMGNKLDEQPMRVGKYQVTVECKGNYSGKATAPYEIY